MHDANELGDPDAIDPITRLPRRDLLALLASLGGGAGLAACAAPEQSPAEPKEAEHADEPAESGSLVAAGDVVLFQGDSITDASRSRETADQANTQSALGGGYAWLAASGLLVESGIPDLSVYNRGISGNKVFQLADRWDADCLALQPDVLSILIGVNDIWHARNGNYDGTVETYERDYDTLLTRTLEALPDVRLVVCEPFVLRWGAVDETWFPEFDTYRAAARRAAEKHGTTWVAFQAMFDRAVAFAPPEHWAGDGVHPSPAGAALMAQAWLRAVGA